MQPQTQTLWMSSLYQLWRFENALPRGRRTPEGYDRLYVPQVGYTTGDVDAHYITLCDTSSLTRSRFDQEEDEDDEKRPSMSALAIRPTAVGPLHSPLFVNTLFSCLASASETHSFRLIWKPPFISRLAAEDRCI